MKKIFVAVVLLAVSVAHGQQYGWQVISRPAPALGLSAGYFIDTVHGWCGGSDSIFRTTDGGATWKNSVQPYLADQIRGISFVDALNGWAVGKLANQVGIIWRTADGGQSWFGQVQHTPDEYFSTASISRLRNFTAGTRYGSLVGDTDRAIL